MPNVPEDILELREAALFSEIAANIERVGWHAMGVLPTVDDPDSVRPFIYSIGFRDTWGHPEVLIDGMSAQQAHALMANVAHNVEEGVVYEPGKRYDNVIQNRDGDRLEVLFREIPAPGLPLNYARHFHQQDEAALQMLWPDREGLFPGEDGYDEASFPQRLATGTEDF